MPSSYASPLVAALEALAPHDHLCSIYESTAERNAVTVPFIRIGLARGEKCICIGDDGAEAAVRHALCADGVDVGRAIANGALVLQTKETTYLKHGSFDPDWMFTFWAEATAEATRQGFTALRVTGETEWVMRGSPGLQRWMDYECRLTHVLAQHNCLALCQYNRRLFPPNVLLDVIRTHPTIIYGGVVCRNMYYVPPHEFLGANQEANEVERLLTSIREREEIEHTLRQQRNELRQIAEHMREVLWVRGVLDDRYKFVSPMYEEVFGRSCASLQANPRSFLDAIHVDDRARVEAAWVRQRAGTPTDDRYPFIRPDGSTGWIRSRGFPVPEPTGPIKRVVGLTEDITESQEQLERDRRSHEVLHQSEQRWRSVCETSAIGMVLGDAAANILASNQAFQELVGYSGEELTKLTVYELTHEADAPLNISLRAELVAGARREMQMEKRLRRKDQTWIWVRVTSSWVPDTEHTPGYVIALVEDITPRRLAEEQLAASVSQSRSLAARLMHAQDDERRRIAQMLHETTAQDLAALKLHLARLNRTASHLTDADRAALTESISLAEQSMTEIRTLSYVLHPPFLDEMGLLSALRWYAAGFAERSGIKLEVELPEHFDRLPLDTETALFRIVQESLINIHRHAGSETARIRLRRDAAVLVLEIEDRGHGIPTPSLERIASRGGLLGVGIAGMRERIEQLGGRLEITSNGQGTTVRTHLPLAQDAG